MTQKKQGGQALIAAVAGLGVVLMGFAGLGLDMGYLRYEKRLQQTAADSAALAGAADLLYGAASVTASARHDATANGFTTGTNNATVTVNSPPLSGPHSGVAGYVEVYVAQVQPTFFMRILGINNETVTARAVAVLTGSSSGGCIYTLDTSGDGILLNGSPNAITANNCGIVDNSGLTVHGHPTITASSVAAVSGSCGSACTPAAIIPIVPEPDPLAYLTPPSTTGPCLVDPDIKKNTTATINPGNYCNGITINAGANVTFNSGVYLVGANGLSASSVGNLTGSGVMFYEYGMGTFNMGGGGTLDVTAPNTSDAATGAIAGILFWQAVSNSNGVTFNGNSSSTIQGGIYAPAAQVTMNGNNSLTLYTLFVVASIRLNGNNSLTVNADTSGVTGGSPIKSAILVE